jgi:hypothetical protein
MGRERCNKKGRKRFKAGDGKGARGERGVVQCAEMEKGEVCSVQGMGQRGKVQGKEGCNERGKMKAREGVRFRVE